MSQISIRTAHVPHALPEQQMAELRAIRSLVQELGGLSAELDSEAPHAPLDSRYTAASPLVRDQFDALANETAAIAAAGLSALIAGRRHGHGGHAAASLLVKEMDRAIGTMERILR